MLAFILLLVIIHVSLILYTSARVSISRFKYKIVAPATTGNLDFERVYRVHQNLIENTIPFSLVLFVSYASLFNFYNYGDSYKILSTVVFICYAVWLLGRIVYSFAYYRDSYKLLIVANTIALISTVILLLYNLVSVGMYATNGTFLGQLW